MIFLSLYIYIYIYDMGRVRAELCSPKFCLAVGEGKASASGLYSAMLRTGIAPAGFSRRGEGSEGLWAEDMARTPAASSSAAPYIYMTLYIISNDYITIFQYSIV